MRLLLELQLPAASTLLGDILSILLLVAYPLHDQ